MGALFHNDENLTVKKLDWTGAIGSVKVITKSVFGKEFGSGFLTRGAELQLFPVIILLKRTMLDFVRPSLEESNFSDLQQSMQFRSTV